MDEAAGGERTPLALLALTVFFAWGAAMAGLAFIALTFPGSAIDSIWSVNPAGREGLVRLGGWGRVLMLGVSLACGATAVGVARRAPWGHTLAAGLLAVNLVGDVLNLVLRGDQRVWVGLPIAGLLLFYLFLPHVRAEFRRGMGE